MGIGLFPVVPGPALSPRPFATAETSYIPWDEAFLVYNGAQRWMNGITIETFGCTGLSATGTDICVPVDFEAGGPFPDDSDFLPFAIRDSVTCSTMSVVGEDLTTFMQMRFLAFRSKYLGAQAWSGAYEPNSLSFASEATVISGAARLPGIALAEMEDAMVSTLNGAIGMIHVTPGMLALLYQGGGLLFDGKTWRTPSGHVIVADAGYDGSQPEGQGAPAADTEWMYGSGPVLFHYGPIVEIGQEGERIDYSRNTITARYEELAIVGFDPCTVSAVLADRTP